MTEYEVPPICPTHKGPAHACPKGCTFTSKSEKEGGSEAHQCKQRVSEAGKGYQALQDALYRRGTDEPPQPQEAGGVNLIFQRQEKSSVVEVHGKGPDAASFEVHVVWDSEKPHAVAGVANHHDLSAEIYLNKTGFAELREVRQTDPKTGKAKREFVLSIEKDGVHIGNPKHTEWSNKLLDLNNKIEGNPKVVELMKRQGLKSHWHGGAPMRSGDELRKIWDEAQALGMNLFGKPKFPEAMDPGPEPPHTIIPFEKIKPLLDIAVATMENARAVVES